MLYGYYFDRMSEYFPAVDTETTFSQERIRIGLSIKDVSTLTGKTERTIYRYERGEIHPEKLVMDAILKLKKNTVETNNRLFTFIDLFAGIGGIRKAFEGVNGKCVFTSEWDKYSQLTYQANFGDTHPIAGDITKIDAANIPAHDVLLAGFPCQPFSIAGVSKKNALGRKHGFLDETQGTLFFDVARIIKHHKPKVLFLENVKNLLNHDKGRTFAVIKSVLEEELGYHIEYGIIDAQHFVPQHRERLYIIGFKKDYGFRFPSLYKKLPEKDTVKLDSILHEHNTQAEPQYTDNKGNPLTKYTLSPKLWDYLQRYAEKHRIKGNGFGFGLFDETGVARTLSARYYKDGSEILIKQDNTRPRRLTPRECAKIMGFDNHTSKFVIPVSDTQAYKQFGNSVVVPVISYICKEIKPFIKEALNDN